jgi:hypothetical protein
VFYFFSVVFSVRRRVFCSDHSRSWFAIWTVHISNIGSIKRTNSLKVDTSSFNYIFER